MPPPEHIITTSCPTGIGATFHGLSRGSSALLSCNITQKLESTGNYTVSQTHPFAPIEGSMGPLPPNTAMRDEQLAIDINRKIKAQILENLKTLDRSEGSAEVPFQLVLGGVCIMVPAIVSAFREALEPQGRKVGVIWFDADADLSLPGDATNVLGCIAFSQMVMRDEALGSMGEFSAPRDNSHGHGEDGTAVGVSNPENTVLFGLNTTREGVIPREHLTYLMDNHYRVFSSKALSRSLLAARTCATQALTYLTDRGCDAIIVHVDVDAIDGGEFPLGNLPNFTGTSFDQFMAALDVFLGEKRVVGLNLTEMNPDRDTGLVMTGRLVDAVVESFGRRASGS